MLSGVLYVSALFQVGQRVDYRVTTKTGFGRDRLDFRPGQVLGVRVIGQINQHALPRPWEVLALRPIDVPVHSAASVRARARRHQRASGVPIRLGRA